MPSFWRGLLITFAVLAPVLCVVGGIGLIVGLRTGSLALPNGMQIGGLSPAPDGYMVNDSTDVIFITFNSPPQQGNNSGTVYTAHVERDIYFHNQAPWTGTESGSNLTIFFGDGTTWRAVWHGTTLMVTYPTTDGQLATEPFNPASTSDYNNAASALQQSTQ